MTALAAFVRAFDFADFHVYLLPSIECAAKHALTFPAKLSIHYAHRLVYSIGIPPFCLLMVQIIAWMRAWNRACKRRYTQARTQAKALARVSGSSEKPPNMPKAGKSKPKRIKATTKTNEDIEFAR